MTPRKRWPNEAEHARMESLSLARRINAQVTPMLDALEQDRIISALELSVRLTRINDSAHRIIHELMACGETKFKD